MIFRQLASIPGSVQSFTLTQKCRPGISEFSPKFAFLLEQQIKFIIKGLCGVSKKKSIITNPLYKVMLFPCFGMCENSVKKNLELWEPSN